MKVNVSIFPASEALNRGWNFQPTFQRKTQPSKALFNALTESAKLGVLVIPVMIRNDEVGDGRKRMLVLQQWKTNEKTPPKGTFSSDWTSLLNGTVVVASDYNLTLPEFLGEFQNHNQINERMSTGELLNAQFHGFPEEVLSLINGSTLIHQSRRLQELSFLGYLLTDLAFNARSADVLKKMVEKKDSITAKQVDAHLKTLVQMHGFSEILAFAIRQDKGIRKPSSKSDQATLLRLIQNYETESIGFTEMNRLREGWIQYVNSTKDQTHRESTGEGYEALAKYLELPTRTPGDAGRVASSDTSKKPAGSMKEKKQSKRA